MEITTALYTLAGTLAEGAISYVLQHQRFKRDIKTLKQQHKTEFTAEKTAKHFPSHTSFTDRSFKTLKKNLGGFKEEELWKILVRAGAIRTYREDGSEWWRLLSRMDEFIDKKQQNQLQ